MFTISPAGFDVFNGKLPEAVEQFVVMGAGGSFPCHDFIKKTVRICIVTVKETLHIRRFTYCRRELLWSSSVIYLNFYGKKCFKPKKVT